MAMLTPNEMAAVPMMPHAEEEYATEEESDDA
jgi:hypothetical protein